MINEFISTIMILSVSGSVLALVLFAGKPLLKNKVSKTFCYYIWLLVLLRLALPIAAPVNIMGAIFGIEQSDAQNVSTRNETIQNSIQPIAQGDPQIVQITPQQGGLVDTQTPVSTQSSFDLWSFIKSNLLGIWFIGTMSSMAWFFIAYIHYMRRIRRSCVTPHFDDLAVFYQMRGDCRVSLACSSHVLTPVLIGVVFPVIVLPQPAYIQNGMEKEFKNILYHELTHYRRKDLLYKWMVVLVTSLHWFNPLMFLIRREIGRACELSCDEVVISRMSADERQNYGNTLLAFSLSRKLPLGILTTTLCEEKSQLKERLISIMKYKKKSAGVTALMFVLALLLTGCAAVLGTVNEGSAIGAPEGELSTDDNETLLQDDVNPIEPVDIDASETVLPLNPDSTWEAFDFSGIEDISFPKLEGYEMSEDCLTLYEALYCLQYAHSWQPDWASGAYTDYETYVEATAVSVTFFGNGVPVDRWQQDRSTYPIFEQDSTPRPAWNMVMQDMEGEAQGKINIYIDAETGDMYNDTNSGGYYPSPYIDRSVYGYLSAAKMSANELTEDIAIELLTTLNYDMWNCQYIMEEITIPNYIANNEKNRFIIDWGNTRMECAVNIAELRLVTEPEVRYVNITSMQALGGGEIEVGYNSYVYFECEEGGSLGVGSEQTVVFTQGSNGWMLSDMGRFPWMMDDYFSAYDQQYGDGAMIPEEGI